MDTRSKIGLGAAVAAVAVSGLFAASSLASANVGNDDGIPSQHQPVSGGGAFDLDGNPVESKMVITDEAPSDLGDVQFEGSATVGESEGSGSFDE